MTVRRLLAEIDSLELTQWQAYERVAGPLGGERGDIQAGLVAATVANTARDDKTQAEPFRPADFMPTWPGAAADDESARGGVSDGR